jgi:hypothetical protein
MSPDEAARALTARFDLLPDKARMLADIYS